MPRKNTCQWNAANESARLQEEDRPSRSQKKRDSTALQNLGEDLAALPESVLDAFPLSAKTREAVREWRRFSSRESKRRQMQYIGRLMREENDIPALREALAAHAAGQAENTRAFRRAEALRDALMNADDQEAARLLASVFPPRSASAPAASRPDPKEPEDRTERTDRARPTAADPAESAELAELTREIMELVRQARNEREHSRPPHAFRALFRNLLRRLRELSEPFPID